jgi:hypothetical protein
MISLIFIRVSSGLPSNLDLVHNLPIARVILCDAESEIMLPLSLHGSCERDGLIVGLDAHVRIRQIWLAIQLVQNLLLNLCCR